MSVTEKGSQNSAIRSRLTFGEQMRHFPWWAVIMIAGLTMAFVWMMGSETYQEALNFIVRPPTSTEVAFGVDIRNGLMMTLFTTLVAYMIALIFGLFLGVMRVSKNPILFHASTLYVELMRGVPHAGAGHLDRLCGGALPAPARPMAPFPSPACRARSSAWALATPPTWPRSTAPASSSISHGQMEAARSLGMGYFQSMRYVILPQAIRRVVPPLANDLVALLKDSALVSVVAVPEILQMARLFVSRTFRAFEGYNSAAFVYLVLTLVFIIIVRLIERRWRTNV